MKYDITKPTAPKMPTLGKGTECIKLLISQASKDMHEPFVPMLFPPLGAHVSGSEFLYPDNSWKELCGLMANIVADSGCNKGQLSPLVEAICRDFRNHDKADGLCGGHKQLSQMLRNIYDRQRAGALRATADGVTGNPILRANLTLSATPFAARKFWKNDLFNGTFGRMVFSYKARTTSRRNNPPLCRNNPALSRDNAGLLRIIPTVRLKETKMFIN